ncbi:MAG: carboxypeptidase-like regulatory domain-containing protein, partial [Planctomycetota bacterium]
TRDGVPLVNNLLTFDLDPPIVVNGFLVSGTVTDAAGAAIPGVGLEARSLSDGSVTASSTTDLGGNFVLDLPVGAHSIELVSGVPAGLVIPSAVIAEVEQTSGVFTAAFDGVPTVDGVLDFILPTGHGSLNGTILVDGVATDGSILVSSGAQLVLEVPTSGGSFDFLLPAGNFNIIAIVPGLDPTLVLPLPFGLAVADTGSVEATQHTFRFDPVDPVVRPGQGLEGFVSLDGAGEGLPIRVTLASGELVTRLSTPASGLWSTTLPPGAFVVAVEPLSVPVGAQNLSSTSVTVTNGTIDGPGVVEGELGFALATTGSTVSGAVSHQQGTPLPGTVVHYRAESVVGSPTVHGFAITDSTGVSSILLGDGRWEIALDGASLPGSVVAPVEAEVEVAGAPVSLDWNLLEAVGTISGTVTIDGLPAADARVLLSIPDTLSDISVVGVAEDGTFTIGAPTGDLGVRAELEGADLSLLVTPSPVRTTITVGSNEAGVDFPYLSTSGEPVLGGRLIGAGQPGPGEVVLSRESSLIPGSFEVHARLQTRFDGIADGWSLALPDGSYQLFVTEWSGAPLLVGPYAIGVSSGAITVDGSSLVGDFDIDLGADPGGPTLTVTGSVLDAGGVGRSGVVIEARPYDGGPTILSTPTDGAGLYTMELPVGAHEMRIASAIADEVLPLPLQSAVVENAGVLELSIAGVAIPAAAVDWNLGAAHGRLTGAVTVNGAAIDAELLAFEGGVLRTRGHAPGGVIDLVLPEGSLTVLAAPIGLPAGMLPPAPLALAVPNTGGIAAF